MFITTKHSVRLTLTKLGVLLFVLLCSHDVFSNEAISDYSKGMRSYMAGEFERAQVHWLNAAKQNDARSMFNLGLLHEQNKISGANLEKSENWYRLAGKHGYAAADFHLVKLKMSAPQIAKQESAQLKALLQRSADNGYKAAQQLLAELTGDRVLISDNKNPVSTKPGASKQDGYLTEAWIANKQSTDWTIQILAFNDKNKVHDFIDRHKLNDTASYFIERSTNGVLYKLIYGSYQSKEEAATARDNLSTDLKVHGPWLRTIASVQALITAN